MFAEQPDSTVSDVETTPASGTYSDPSGAAEPPTADATEPGSDPAPSETQAGQPRDEHGRFRPRADQAPGNDPAEDPTAPAAQDPDAPAAPPGSDPAPALTATVGSGEAASAATDQPFTFAHRGQTYALDGVVVKPDGSVVIPPGSVSRVERMFTRAREHEVFGPQLVQQHQREVGALRQQLEAKHAGVEAFGQLFEGSPDLETFLTRAAEFYETLPALRQQMTEQALAERDRRIAELEGRAPNGTPNGQPGQDNGPPPEVLAQAIRSGAADMLAQLPEAVPAFKGFRAEELQPLLPHLLRRSGLFVRLATPEDEQVYGTPAGSPVVDADAFVQEVTLLAGDAIRAKQAQAATAQVKPKVDAAAQRNAKVLSAVKAPPVPRPASDVAGGRGPKKYDSYEEWHADAMSGRLLAG